MALGRCGEDGASQRRERAGKWGGRRMWERGSRGDARTGAGETAADRALRLKSNFAAHGLRTCVHGVLLVELSGHPHVLLLQVRNSSFLLPGGRLRPAEQDVQGLKRKLSSKLASADPNGDHHWQEDVDVDNVQNSFQESFADNLSQEESDGPSDDHDEAEMDIEEAQRQEQMLETHWKA
ncbi:hypothetical protein TRIUR3_19279 [Triticum urartu]|uniref:Uncharacterized protein n=1 Tax=Triticum urartu TaxID=4572 RepID=M7YN25_TRIUA|nr:hypothetical protein TRIUR3_19279 [Triticum urartu]